MKTIVSLIGLGLCLMTGVLHAAVEDDRFFGGAQDGWASQTMPAAMPLDSGVVNSAPTVGAGADQVIALPAGANLSGTVTDDGLPNPPAAVTVGWSVMSGPGTVTFGNAATATTTATFSAAGVYVLHLGATDGALLASDELQITVLPAGTLVNQAPLVDAGPDQAVSLLVATNLSGAVSDDGLPNPPAAVTVAWSLVSGPGIAAFADAHAATTTVSLSAAGLYVLRLTASDGALSAADEVRITAGPSSSSSTSGPTRGAQDADHGGCGLGSGIALLFTGLASGLGGLLRSRSVIPAKV